MQDTRESLILPAEADRNCLNCLHLQVDDNRCFRCVYCPRPPGYHSLIDDQLDNLWEWNKRG